MPRTIFVALGTTACVVLLLSTHVGCTKKDQPVPVEDPSLQAEPVAEPLELFGGRPEERQITLELKSYVSPDDCVIEVEPDPATLYLNKKMKRPEWIAVENSQYMDSDGEYTNLFWELTHKDSDIGTPYFEDLEIKCNKVREKGNKITDPVSASSYWDYSVTVYACDGNDKAQELCSIDPRVKW